MQMSNSWPCNLFFWCVCTYYLIILCSQWSELSVSNCCRSIWPTSPSPLVMDSWEPARFNDLCDDGLCFKSSWCLWIMQVKLLIKMRACGSFQGTGKKNTTLKNKPWNEDEIWGEKLVIWSGTCGYTMHNIFFMFEARLHSWCTCFAAYVALHKLHFSYSWTYCTFDPNQT